MNQLDLLSLLVPRYSNTSKTWPRGRSLTSTLIQLSQVRMCNYQLIASYLNEFIKISSQRTVLRPSSILIFKLDTCLASLIHILHIVYSNWTHVLLGNYTLDGGATPLVHHALYEATKKVPNPNTAQAGRSVYDNWKMTTPNEDKTQPK